MDLEISITGLAVITLSPDGGEGDLANWASKGITRKNAVMRLLSGSDNFRRSPEHPDWVPAHHPYMIISSDALLGCSPADPEGWQVLRQRKGNEQILIPLDRTLIELEPERQEKQALQAQTLNANWTLDDVFRLDDLLPPANDPPPRPKMTTTEMELHSGVLSAMPPLNDAFWTADWRVGRRKIGRLTDRLRFIYKSASKKQCVVSLTRTNAKGVRSTTLITLAEGGLLDGDVHLSIFCLPSYIDGRPRSDMDDVHALAEIRNPKITDAEVRAVTPKWNRKVNIEGGFCPPVIG